MRALGQIKKNMNDIEKQRLADDMAYFYNNQHSSTETKRVDSLFRFYKNITTLSVGLLGLLIGLKPDDILDSYSRNALFLGLSLLVACILFSLIVQYYETILLNREARIYLQRREAAKALKLEEASKYERVPTGLPYYTFQILTCVCLALSLISLIYYAYLTF